MKFTDLQLDLEAFAKHPKCTKQWEDKLTGAGCLLTAFFKAIGLQGNGTGSFWKEESPHIRFDSYIVINVICEELGIDRYIGHMHRTAEIISLYDKGNGMKALELLWEIIDKWPNKKGHSQIKDVVLPKSLKE